MAAQASAAAAALAAPVDPAAPVVSLDASPAVAASHGGGGGGGGGGDGRQLFSHEIAFRTKYNDKRPEAWLETTMNYLSDRSHGMEPFLEWVAKQQLRKIAPQDVQNVDAGMHNPEALSRNLWGYLNLAVAGTTAASDFHKVKRLNGLEAWRRIVVSL